MDPSSSSGPILDLSLDLGPFLFSTYDMCDLSPLEKLKALRVAPRGRDGLEVELGSFFVLRLWHLPSLLREQFSMLRVAPRGSDGPKLKLGSKIELELELGSKIRLESFFVLCLWHPPSLPREQFLVPRVAPRGSDELKFKLESFSILHLWHLPSFFTEQLLALKVVPQRMMDSNSRLNLISNLNLNLSPFFVLFVWHPPFWRQKLFQGGGERWTWAWVCPFFLQEVPIYF